MAQSCDGNPSDIRIGRTGVFEADILRKTPVIVPRYAEYRADLLPDIAGKQIFVGLGAVEISDRFVDKVFSIFDQLLPSGRLAEYRPSDRYKPSFAASASRAA